MCTLRALLLRTLWLFYLYCIHLHSMREVKPSQRWKRRTRESLQTFSYSRRSFLLCKFVLGVRVSAFCSEKCILLICSLSDDTLNVKGVQTVRQIRICADFDQSKARVTSIPYVSIHKGVWSKKAEYEIEGCKFVLGVRVSAFCSESAYF